MNLDEPTTAWEHDAAQTREQVAIRKLLILSNVFLFLIVLGVWVPFLLSTS